jgi:hypothetical protein
LICRIIPFDPHHGSARLILATGTAFTLFVCGALCIIHGRVAVAIRVRYIRHAAAKFALQYSLVSVVHSAEEYSNEMDYPFRLRLKFPCQDGLIFEGKTDASVLTNYVFAKFQEENDLMRRRAIHKAVFVFCLHRNFFKHRKLTP